MASTLVGTLRFSEAEHGWALDTGSFLAAWATAIRGLALSESNQSRLSFVRYAQLYAFNIVRRLVIHDIKVDAKIFEPKDLDGMASVFREVTNKIQNAKSSAHCVFLLLGSATTYVELGLKPGMPSRYYEQLNECAISCIERMRELRPGDSELRSEAVRVELLQLGGNVDKLRKILSIPPVNAISSDSHVIGVDAQDRKRASVVCESLPELMANVAI